VSRKEEFLGKKTLTTLWFGVFIEQWFLLNGVKETQEPRHPKRGSQVF
jgi:hypothetical protein